MGVKLHARAEEILSEALNAQGRKPDAYSADEYVLALSQAQRELEPQHETKALLAELGMLDDDAHQIAREIGNDLYMLRGKVLTADELRLQVEQDVAQAEQHARFLRELGRD
jgi:hypothetical protein